MKPAAKQPAPESFGMFRVNQAKQKVSVSRTTLRKWICNGLPVFKMGKARFVKFADVERYIEMNAEN